MNSDEFRAAIEAVWGAETAQTCAARHWGVSTRSIRRYVSGERPVPDWMAVEVSDLKTMSAHGADIGKAVAAAHRISVNAGWDDSTAAAGILACAINNAAQHLGRDAVAELLKSHLSSAPRD